ncbi:MAG: UbiD family decarboxylase [Candidatus Binatia bacterium]
MQDLRGLIDNWLASAQLKVVEGADCDLEIGAISEVSGSGREPPALLFDKISGYPKGFRVLVNMFQTQRRTSMALGLSDTLRGLALVNVIRQWMEDYEPLPPKPVISGSVMDNILEGKSIDVFKFPAPKLHKDDGGRYIGTQDAVITRDLEADWVNLGTARVQLQDPSTVSIYISPGKQTRLIAERYWERKQSCPVAIVCGIEPALFAAASLGLPWGVSEYDFAGHIRRDPVKVISGQYTGLPIPADAEIVFEGEMPPPDVDSRPEGPFGEWTGYYASGTRPAPVVHVKRVYYRAEPIITVVADLKIYPLDSYLSILFRSAEIWNELEKCGITDVKGVWLLESGLRFLLVISIRQRYGGHARQAAHVAVGAREGGYLGRFVIVVDEDIDPSNMADVLWAMATRCDPETSIEIVRGCWSSPIDPRIPPEKRKQGDFTNSRAIIDACRPFTWMRDYPKVHALEPEELARISKKWSHILP